MRVLVHVEAHDNNLDSDYTNRKRIGHIIFGIDISPNYLDENEIAR